MLGAVDITGVAQREMVSDINPPSSRYATTYHEKVLRLFLKKTLENNKSFSCK